jgi:hypothetical protein
LGILNQNARLRFFNQQETRMVHCLQFDGQPIGVESAPGVDRRRSVEFRLLRHTVPCTGSGEFLPGMQETPRQHEQNYPDFGAWRAPPLSIQEKHSFVPGSKVALKGYQRALDC